MCDQAGEVYCEKFKLSIELQKIITTHTTQDQNGVSYVRVQYIENLINELECENVQVG